MRTINNLKLKPLALAGSGFIFLLIIWLWLTNGGYIAPVLLPSPQNVFKAGQIMFQNGQLGSAFLASGERIMVGFLISAAISIPLGLLIGSYRPARTLLAPILAFIRYIPPSAFIPLMIVWLGISEAQKISVVILAIAPYFCLMVADAAAATKPELINSALTLGASKSDVFWQVIAPHSMPAAWDSGRIMLGASWSFVIISEIVGSNNGLGHLITESQRYLQTANIFAAIIIIGLIGLVSDFILHHSSKLIFPWFHHAAN
ncbi:MAG: ABC transporter permease [Candidatus Doudnabacteria bacterium]|nr:ABC transporter permease [Candidatus Doudnabacteria bacterium]